MYFTVTIAYETEQVNRDGNPKMKKIKYVVQSESAEEATIIAANFRKGDNRFSEIDSIVKLNIDCVLDIKNTPELYGK